MDKYKIRGVFWGATMEEVAEIEKQERVSSSIISNQLEYEIELYRHRGGLTYIFNRHHKDSDMGLIEIKYQFPVPQDDTGVDLHKNLYKTLKKLHGKPVLHYRGLGDGDTWVIHNSLTMINLNVVEDETERWWLNLVYRDNGKEVFGRKRDYRKEALKELGG